MISESEGFENIKAICKELGINNIRSQAITRSNAAAKKLGVVVAFKPEKKVQNKQEEISVMMSHYAGDLSYFPKFPNIPSPEGTVNDLCKLFTVGGKTINEEDKQNIKIQVKLTAKLDGENIALVFGKDGYISSITRQRTIQPSDEAWLSFLKKEGNQNLFQEINDSIRNLHPGIDKVIITGEFCHDEKLTLADGFYIHGVRNGEGKFLNMGEIYEKVCKTLPNGEALFTKKKGNKHRIYFMEQFYNKEIIVSLQDLEKFEGIQERVRQEGLSFENTGLDEINAPLDKYSQNLSNGGGFSLLRESLEEMSPCPVVSTFYTKDELSSHPPAVVSAEGYVMQLLRVIAGDLSYQSMQNVPISKAKFCDKVDLKLGFLKPADCEKTKIKGSRVDYFIKGTLTPERIKKLQTHLLSKLADNITTEKTLLVGETLSWAMEDTKRELGYLGYKGDIDGGWINKNWDTCMNLLKEKIDMELKKIINEKLTEKEPIEKIGEKEHQKEQKHNKAMFFNELEKEQSLTTSKQTSAEAASLLMKSGIR